MRARAGLLVLLAALPLTGQALAAAPRPVCRVLPDVRGDAAVRSPMPGATEPLAPGGPTDDLLSADVASDGRVLTAVLRLADLVTPDPSSPTGRAYGVLFRVRGTDAQYSVVAYAYPGGTRFLLGRTTSVGPHSYVHALADVRGALDVAHDQVRVHVPTGAFSPDAPVRRGTVLVDLQAHVYRVVGQPLADPSAVPVPGLETARAVAVELDAAEGVRYVVGTRSCVRPGA